MRTKIGPLGAVFCAIVTIVTVSTIGESARACSAFAATTEKFSLMAKSYDWLMSHGIVLINKRGMAKQSLVLKSGDLSIGWTAKYGSVTYTQFGRDFPVSGMNEKGLAIEVLWDYDNEGPSESGDLPAINEAQWVQYQLDISANVAEVIANARYVRMKRVHAPVHYLACDSEGACATFEFRGTNVIVKEGPTQVLTNSDYQQSLDHLLNFSGFGGATPIPWRSTKSLDRFAILASQIKDVKNHPNIEMARENSWQLLDSVRQPGTSVWHLVHDLRSKTSQFRRMFDESVTRTVDLRQYELSCSSPALIADIEEDGDGPFEFKSYDSTLNRATVELSGAGLGIDGSVVNAVSAYPETTYCTESSMQ